MNSKQELLTLLIQHQQQLKTLGVKRLGLFGSFVRNETTPNSDVDFLVEFELGQKKFDNFMNLSFLLEDLLQRRIELITPESLSPYLAPYILKEVENVPFTG